MRYAILSDVHGRRQKLEAVLCDARQRGAERILSLGDVGGHDCLTLLRQAGAEAVLGNYEVSGWRRLGPKVRAWVRDWPPMLEIEDFWAVHAVPWWPEGLQSTADFDEWMSRVTPPWHSVFPYLGRDPEMLWQVLIELEHAGKRILFHGHTHQQVTWQWEPSGRLRRVQGGGIELQAGCRYVVGVGSVGLPEDACWAAYTLYDSELSQIDPVCFSAHRP